MYEQSLVNGLPLIKFTDDVFESCIVGKHHRDAFPKGKAKRAATSAE